MIHFISIVIDQNIIFGQNLVMIWSKDKNTKLFLKMNVKYGQASLLDCFKNKTEPAAISSCWLFHFILQLLTSL